MTPNFESSDFAAVAEMQARYWKSMTGPQDCYWQEGIIAAGDVTCIREKGQPIGYLVRDANKRLMQFHVEAPFHRAARDLFRATLDACRIDTALASTIEPLYFALCLDHSTHANVDTYLFSDHSQPDLANLPFVASNNEHQFRRAVDDDLHHTASLMRGDDEFIDSETVEEHFGDELGYAKTVIEAGILHVLERGTEILAVGELRERAQWVPFADVGMIVKKEHRRNGIGTYVLTQLKREAKRRGLTPICSCDANNVGSRKAVERAGFVAYQRIVEFSL